MLIEDDLKNIFNLKYKDKLSIQEIIQRTDFSKEDIIVLLEKIVNTMKDI